ncbi:MAG: C40 family peptidase, partial [Cellulomonas sp.]|nr:C40 family peptidase [Cellulomonas sp.]
ADPPSDDDVRRARDAVTQAAGSVAAMEAELAQLTATEQTTQIAVQAAGEAYSQALETSQQADAAAATAAAEKATADGAVEASRTQLVQVARQLSTTSGSSDALTAILSADDFQDMAERTAQLEHVTGRTEQVVQMFQAAQTVAQTMDQRAQETATAATTAKTTAETALAQAEQAATAAQATLSSAQGRRDQLVTELAAAQNTSVEVEQARQASIAAAREAQARADVTTRPAKTSAPANPSGGSGGSSGGGSTGGSTSGSSGGGSGSGGSSTGSATAGETAVAWARTQIGKPYLWGGSGPDAYDCSGLTQQAWRQAGVSLAHSSRTQYTQVKKVPISDLRVGDLVFWASNTSDPSTIYHVALYAGGGTIVEAPAPGLTIRTMSLRYANLMPYGGRP